MLGKTLCQIIDNIDEIDKFVETQLAKTDSWKNRKFQYTRNSKITELVIKFFPQKAPPIWQILKQ